jgi:chaperonin GroES
MATSHPVPKLAVVIKPLGDRVVVVPLEAEQVTASGIVIPDTAKGEKPQEGVVVALGTGGVKTSEGEVSNPHDFLKVGDKILFGKYSGDEVKMKTKEGKDVEVKILRLDSVLGIVQ